MFILKLLLISPKLPQVKSESRINVKSPDFMSFEYLALITLLTLLFHSFFNLLISNEYSPLRKFPEPDRGDHRQQSVDTDYPLANLADEACDTYEDSRKKRS